MAKHATSKMDSNSTSARKALAEMGSDSELSVVDSALKLMSLDNCRFGDVGPINLDDAAQGG